jgi:hypothetical protein
MLRNGILFALVLMMGITVSTSAHAVGPVDGRFVFGPKVGATFTLVDGYQRGFTEQEWGVDAGAGVVLGYRFSRHPNDVGVGLESGAFFMRRHISGIDVDAVYGETWSSLEIPLLLTIHAPVISSARPRMALGPYFNIPVQGDAFEPALLALQASVGVEVDTGVGDLLIEFAYQRQLNAYNEDEEYKHYAQSVVGFLGVLF